MPVSAAIAESNRVQTERLRNLVQRLNPAKLAVRLQAAEEVDDFLLSVPDEVVATALTRSDRPNLDRGSHREDHLNSIERALAAAGLS